MSLSSGGFGDRDVLADLGYPFYQRLFGDGSDFTKDLGQKLDQARMPYPVEIYLSRALSIGVLSGAGLWFLGVFLGYFLFATGLIEVGTLLGIPVYDEATLALLEAIKIPALVVVTGVVFGSIGFVLGFISLLAVPYMKVSERSREINMLLPDAVSFMYALSIGGLNQLEIIEAMAKADDTYGEVAREFQSIVKETEYFDTDYRTAIREQALKTPSDELAQFLTDMMSIINSGGDMTSFLDDKKDKHMRTAKQQQELTLETLELFGEMYMTLSLFPLLLIIVIVIMSMLGKGSQQMLLGTVYGLIPMVGVGFLVLISTVKKDEPGDGYLEVGEGVNRSGSGSDFSLSLVNAFTGEFGMFDRIKNREGVYILTEILKAPHRYFKDNPLYTLGFTVPIAIGIVTVTVVQGNAPTSIDAFIGNAVWGTFLYAYVPLYVTLLPLTVFYEWNQWSRRGIVSGLSEDLRKLASANETGLTLLESVRTVADTSSGSLADEFETIYAKVQYGTSLRAAFIEFNNKYHIPRLARTIKLISKAQETSSQITDVLTTAAQASENQDDIDRERKSRTRMQVVIILMTYLTLLAVMAILKTQFLDVMAGLTEQASQGGGGGGGGSGQFGAGVDPAMLSVLFFHAVTVQAIISGFIAGYIRSASLQAGLKFVVILQTIALATWMMVG